MEQLPAEPSTSRSPIAMGFAGAAIAVAVALVAWFLVGDDDAAKAGPGDVAASVPDDTSTDTTGPEETSTTGQPDQLAGAVPLDDVLDDMIAFVEQERGLSFKERPVVQTQPEDEFVEQLIATQNEEFEEDAEELALYSRLYQLLGILDDGVTLQDALNSTGSDGVLGYYETEKNELYIRGTEVTPFVRSVIVHELVHALDDQHFELYRPEYDDSLDEVGFGFSAVTEGNASVIEDAYVAEYSDDEIDEYIAEQLGFSYDLSVLTTEFLELQVAPYTAGPGYVDAVLDDGGQTALAAAFDDPPNTSEAVLHPERRDEPAVDVPAPDADGEVMEEGLVGELFLEIMLGSAVGSADAESAADGWGGDWYVMWEDDGDLCFRMVAVGDTDEDTDELAGAMSRWADANEAEITESETGAPVLTVCG